MENFFLWGQELPLPGQRTRRDSLVGILLDDGVSKIEFYEDAGWTGTGVGLYQWTRAGIQRVDVASLPVATSERASESLTGDHAE